MQYTGGTISPDTILICKTNNTAFGINMQYQKLNVENKHVIQKDMFSDKISEFDSHDKDQYYLGRKKI